MYQTSDIKKGLKIEIDGKPWVVTEFLFVKPGKGCAFTRTKLKNMINGSTLDRTYKTGESMKPADIVDIDVQYMYKDDESFHFMNMESFDQFAVPLEVLSDYADFMLEDAEMQMMLFQGRPVSVELPNHIEVEITYCEPGVKGNTAQGGTKPATVSTGATVQVPLFVENGEWIKVDTRTREYVERVRK